MMCIEWSSCFQSTDTSILYLSSLDFFQIKSMDMGAVMTSLRMVYVWQGFFTFQINGKWRPSIIILDREKRVCCVNYRQNICRHLHLPLQVILRRLRLFHCHPTAFSVFSPPHPSHAP